MGLMCCYGHILHPISTDLLLLCGVLMTAVGGRWLALISFVSLIMRLSQRGLAEGLRWGLFWTSASLFVLGEPAAPARKKSESSLACREVRSIRQQGQKVWHESSLKDDMAQGHIYGLAPSYLLLSRVELPVISLAPRSSIEINYFANNFWGPRFSDIELVCSPLIASA